jgi:hypothetical protein
LENSLAPFYRNQHARLRVGMIAFSVNETYRPSRALLPGYTIVIAA